MGAGLASLISGQVFAQENENPYASLQNVAGESGHSVIAVKTGTPLWKVASEYTFGNDDLTDGIRNIGFCDSVADRQAVVKANNEIATLTGKLAVDARAAFGADSIQYKALTQLHDAVLLDGVRISVSAEECGTVTKEEGNDGVLGDGFANLTGYNGTVSVVVPNKYIASQCIILDAPVAAVVTEAPEATVVTEAPVVAEVPETRKERREKIVVTPEPLVTTGPTIPETTPVSSTPVVLPYVQSTDSDALFPSNYVALGGQGIYESGAAALYGAGLVADGRLTHSVSDKGALFLEADRVAGISSRYVNTIDSINTVKIGDLDLSAGYRHLVGPHASLGLGLNLDARTADVMYAGVSARTGQWALGPEVTYRFDNGENAFELEGSLGWGFVAANVDVPGYEKTNDGFTKAKLGASYTTRVGEKWKLGLEADVESDTGARSTQDAGMRHWDDARISAGPTAEYALGKGWAVRCEAGPVYSTDADVVSAQAQCAVKKEW